MGILNVEERFFLDNIPNQSGLMLDIGGGTAPLKDKLENLGYKYLNMDISSNQKPHILADANKRLPFNDETFKLITSTHSLEHFHNTELIFDEVYRCLTSQGIFVALVPFLHPYHDEDYWRPTHLGLKKRLKNAGFADIEIHANTSLVTLFGVVISVFFNKLNLNLLRDTTQNLFANVESSALKLFDIDPIKWAHSLYCVAKK